MVDSKEPKKELIQWDLNKIPFEIRETIYSNAVKISFSEIEVCLEYAILPPKENNKIESIRIFIHPKNFKLFLDLFNEQFKRYQEAFGSQ